MVLHVLFAQLPHTCACKRILQIHRISFLITRVSGALEVYLARSQTLCRQTARNMPRLPYRSANGSLREGRSDRASLHAES